MASGDFNDVQGITLDRDAREVADQVGAAFLKKSAGAQIIKSDSERGVGLTGFQERPGTQLGELAEPPYLPDFWHERFRGGGNGTLRQRQGGRRLILEPKWLQEA